MRVEWQTGGAPERLYHRQANRDIRHEMPVHHVAMHDARAAALDGRDVFAKSRKISR